MPKLSLEGERCLNQKGEEACRERGISVEGQQMQRLSNLQKWHIDAQKTGGLK